MQQILFLILSLISLVSGAASQKDISDWLNKNQAIYTPKEMAYIDIISTIDKKANEVVGTNLIGCNLNSEESAIVINKNNGGLEIKFDSNLINISQAHSYYWLSRGTEPGFFPVFAKAGQLQVKNFIHSPDLYGIWVRQGLNIKYFSIKMPAVSLDGTECQSWNYQIN